MTELVKKYFIIIIILSLFLVMAPIQAQDINNNTIGFTNDHTGHLPSIPGIGAVPAMPAMRAIPAKANFKAIQARPGFGGWAETLFESYISED